MGAMTSYLTAFNFQQQLQTVDVVFSFNSGHRMKSSMICLIDFVVVNFLLFPVLHSQTADDKVTPSVSTLFAV